ncbi:methyl-accepting chemotaxis protein [Stutzerimonas tarimensis]|uniref:Methyl-accepting chemotaxis protein n=1 Tax=Stutzerimonas tarimensis TaxID=1507735 RepID=A0ABV7T6Q5_9GAMM
MSTTAIPTATDQAGPIIFRTDLDGVLNLCNDALVEASGFNRSALLGQPCSILRHPETPDAVVADLWRSLRAGRPWAGVVKNRRRDGSGFWIDLYIMRVFDGDRHVGYGAMARRADAGQIDRASRLYRRLGGARRRPQLAPGTLDRWMPTALCSLVTLGLALAAGAPPVLAALATLPLPGLHLWQARRQHQAMRELLEGQPSACNSALSAGNYSDGDGPTALAALALHGHNARLHTALLRIGMAGQQVEATAMDYAARVQRDAESLETQRNETDQAATAICEMVATVQEIASHVHLTAESAAEASGLADGGQEMAERNLQSMGQLSTSVQGIGDAIARLAEASDSIGGVVEVINAIAEQTNLLALNAAIEAARAGEQGRGFAVVADEVRSLALRTQQSTEQIRQLIAGLRQSTQRTVEMSSQGVQLAHTCAADVGVVREALQGIAASVAAISGMSQQMAVATEEQTQVANDISQQIERIAQLSSRNADSAREGAQSSQLLLSQAESLHGLARRFDR